MAGYSIKAGGVVLTPDKGPDELKTVWDVVWAISEKNDETAAVGNLWFTGEPERGAVELDFTIDKKYTDTEYTKDVLRSITEWVFKRKDLYEIKTTVNTDDKERIKALESTGFVLRTANKEISQYSIEKQKTGWMGLYIALGLCAGVLLGILINNMVIGVIAGIVVGVAVGVFLDIKASLDRYNITGEKRMGHRKAIVEVEIPDKNESKKDEE